MDDIYSAIIGEPTSDKEKLILIAQQLRKKQLLGQLGQITGDRVLSPMGAGMVKQVGEQAEDIGRRGETARYRRYQEKQSADSLAQRQAEQKAQEAHDRAQLAYQYKALADNNETRRLMKAMDAEARKAAESEKAALAREKRNETQATNISNKLNVNMLPALITAAKGFNEIAVKYRGKKGLPGIGTIESNVSPYLLGEDAQLVRSRLAAPGNLWLKLLSGAAVTAPETERFINQLASGGGYSEETFKKQWPEVLKLIRAQQDNVYAGGSPEARDLYLERGGLPYLDTTDPFAPDPKEIKVLR